MGRVELVGLVGSSAPTEVAHRVGRKRGPAEAGLDRVAFRYAAAVRLAMAVICVAVVPFTLPPDRIAVAAAAGLAALAWSVWCCVRLLRRRDRGLVALDAAVVCVLCLAQPWTLPADASFDDPSLLLSLVSASVVSYPWHVRAGAAATASVAILVAYVGGGVLAGSATLLATLAATVWIPVQATLSAGLFALLRRGARRADATAAGEALQRQAATVAAACHADHREYLAVLHDTAATTLMMVGLGTLDGRADWLSDQAGRDLELLAGGPERGIAETDLVPMLRHLERFTRIGVRWEVAAGSLLLPQLPAVAICRAVQEAVTNAARHAGVDTVTVRAGLEVGGVVVVVVDRGRGFVPERVAAGCRGLAYSVAERMDRVGGRAEVTSWPGEGTEVRLSWSPTPTGVDARQPEVTSAEPTESAEVTEASFLHGLQRGVIGIVLVVPVVLTLPTFLAEADVYRSLGLVVGALAVMAVVAVLGSVLVSRTGTPGRWRWPMVLAVLGASAAVNAAIPAAHQFGQGHITYGLVGWIAVLLLMDRGLRAFLPVLGVHHGLALGQALLVGQTDATALTGMVMIEIVFQCITVHVASELRRIASTAAGHAAAEERSRTERAISERLQRERQDRYAALDGTAVPLLAGLAAGTDDPGDSRVRRACAVEAGRMRRLFAESDDVADPLLHELQACIGLAEGNGAQVSLATRGQRPALPAEVRRALTAPVLAVIAAAASVARVTVVASPAEVSISVVTDAPPHRHPDVDDPAQPPGGSPVTVNGMTVEGRSWLEATWRAEP